MVGLSRPKRKAVARAKPASGRISGDQALGAIDDGRLCLRLRPGATSLSVRSKLKCFFQTVSPRDRRFA
jgi:hypothetical protein